MLVKCINFLGSEKKLTSVHCQNIITFKMVKRTSQERLKVVILRDLGHSWEKIREKMSFSNKSTAQTIYKNYPRNSSVNDTKGSGRPPKLTRIDQNRLRRIVKKNNKASAEKLRVLFNSFSMKTVYTKTILKNSVWNNVKDSFIEKLYSSMPNRISQCIRNSGFSIKY